MKSSYVSLALFFLLFCSTLLFRRWRPPKFVRDRSSEENRRICEKNHIIVEGEDCPPPIDNFTDMKVPDPLVKFLKSKRITKPTPIQLQGIPTA